MSNIHAVIDSLKSFHNECHKNEKFRYDKSKVKTINGTDIAECCDTNVAKFMTEIHNNFNTLIDYIEGLELDIEYYKDREDLDHERYRYNDY